VIVSKHAGVLRLTSSISADALLRQSVEGALLSRPFVRLSSVRASTSGSAHAQ